MLSKILQERCNGFTELKMGIIGSGSHGSRDLPSPCLVHRTARCQSIAGLSGTVQDSLTMTRVYCCIRCACCTEAIAATSSSSFWLSGDASLRLDRHSSPFVARCCVDAIRLDDIRSLPLPRTVLMIIINSFLCESDFAADVSSSVLNFARRIRY